ESRTIVLDRYHEHLVAPAYGYGQCPALRARQNSMANSVFHQWLKDERRNKCVVRFRVGIHGRSQGVAKPHALMCKYCSTNTSSSRTGISGESSFSRVKRRKSLSVSTVSAALVRSPSRISVAMPFRALNRKCGFNCDCSARSRALSASFSAWTERARSASRSSMALMPKYSEDHVDSRLVK